MTIEENWFTHLMGELGERKRCALMASDDSCKWDDPSNDEFYRLLEGKLKLERKFAALVKEAEEFLFLGVMPK